MKNYSIIAAVVALALTLAFIVQFTGANQEVSEGRGAVHVGEELKGIGPKQANTVSRQEVRIQEPGVTSQAVKVTR